MIAADIHSETTVIGFFFFANEVVSCTGSPDTWCDRRKELMKQQS